MSDKLDEIATRTWDVMTEVERTHKDEIRIIRAALDEARQEARREALEECVTLTPPDFMLAVKSKWIREAVAEERKALREIVRTQDVDHSGLAVRGEILHKFDARSKR